MSVAPWICRSCIRSLSQPIGTQFLRRASTKASPSSIPAVLLRRAQKLTQEHDTLKQSLATNYDVKAAKRAGEIARIADTLRQWEAAQNSVAELSAMLQSTDSELRELAQDELGSTSTQIEQLEKELASALAPKHPFADMPCLLEIRPGPGGLEGRLFADEVFRMYQSYCANQGHRARVVKYEHNDAGIDGEKGLQEAVLHVQTEGAYAAFRGESGMHRVQRVPATEKNGRTHTSAVAVWVLPSFPESASDAAGADFDDPDSDFYIDPTDVRTEKMRASGAGGQHVNKTESAIRLTHIPTNTVVSMQDSRSQHQNREAAWQILRSRVAAQRREEREELARSMKRSVLSAAQITRGDKIRTYNYSQDRCTDHRVGMDVHNLPDVLEGGEGLDRIIRSVRDWLTGKDVEALIAEEEAAVDAAPSKAAGGK